MVLHRPKGRRRAPLAPASKPWPSPQASTVHTVVLMPQRGGNFFHLHLVSDATGETLITVARAAAAQYATVAPIEHIYPLVRNEKQLERVISEIEAAPGVVLYTLLDRPLVERLETKCREFGVPYLSILGPVLTLFQSYLGAESTRRVGAQHTLNADYFKRIDALNYTMLHDDGQHTDDLEHADVRDTPVSTTSACSRSSVCCPSSCSMV